MTKNAKGLGCVLPVGLSAVQKVPFGRIRLKVGFHCSAALIRLPLAPALFVTGAPDSVFLDASTIKPWPIFCLEGTYIHH